MTSLNVLIPNDSKIFVFVYISLRCALGSPKINGNI